MVATARDAHRDELARFTDRVVAVLEAIEPQGKVRVLINTEHVEVEGLTALCQAMTGAGVWLVQGGTFLGDQANLTHLAAMRQALGPRTLPKLTHPVRSLSALLVGWAEGVNRFNGDPQGLLAQATQACWVAPLQVPERDLGL